MTVRFGTAGADLVLGTADDDTLFGGVASAPGADASDDTLSGGAGDDLLLSAGGSDRLFGGAGADSLFADPDGAGPFRADTLNGGDGDDYLASRGGGDLLDGGAGEDIGAVDLAWATAGLVFVASAAPGAVRSIAGEGTRLVNVEHYHLGGGRGADSLAGGAGDDVLDGGPGGAADTLRGGGGGNSLWTHGGRDLLDGGAGADLAIINRTGATAALSFVAPSPGVWGTLTGDGTRLRDIERYDITGGAGADRFLLGAGNDALNGGGGADTLSGGAGEDAIWGGPGADRLIGGGGADTFLYSVAAEGADTIVDFTPGEDHLAAVAFGFGGGLVAGQDLAAAGAFAANATGLAEAAHAQFVYQVTPGATAGRLWWDVDGTGDAPRVLVALLAGKPTLAADAILLL